MEWLEVTLPKGRKAVMKKVVILDLIIDNMIFTQQYFVLPFTNPILLGSNFLDNHFVMLDIGHHTISLHCNDYMLTISLPIILYIISA